MTIATRQANLFPLGQLLISRGVIDAGIPALPLVVRHASGDWGDISDDDRDLNERALAKGGRLFSAYDLSGGRRVWIITEASRSATMWSSTVLLPEEY
jgi:hypothetical protein